jgi:hypothetical protein
MSDNYFEESRTTSLVYWATGHMLKGAAVAGFFVVLVYAVIWAVWGLGQLLPEDSKTAPPPMGALELTLGGTFA